MALIRLPEVKQQTGLSRSQIYFLEGQGRFPSRVSIGARSVAWVSDEVEQWIKQRIAESRNRGSVQ